MSANDISRNLDRLVNKVMTAAETGVQDACDDLLRVSRNIAPLDKGTLRMTSFSDVKKTRDTVEGEVVYSAVESGPGGRFNYALRMHEMGEYKNPTTPGTRPKYLSGPLQERANLYDQMINDAIRRELG